MAINVKEYLVSRIRELYPDAATRPDLKPGSAFYDLLILPLAALLTEYQEEHQTILSMQSITDPTLMEEEDLDAIALNFLQSRNSGTKASGYVKFYYNRAVTLNIPKKTILKTNLGLEFEIVSNIYVPKVQMENNIIEYPYYDSGEIYILAKEAGDEYNLPVNTQFTIDSAVGVPTPVKIINNDPFTSGVLKEGNQTFFDRIKSSVYNKSLASKESIDAKVKELYPTVIKTEVVGAGNALMVRDLATLDGAIEDFVEEDFYLTYSGKHEGVYDSQHVALVGVFNDMDESANVEVPPPTSWESEFSDAMYQGVYSLDDRDYAIYEQDTIIREDWGDTLAATGVQPSLALILASGMTNYWSVHDGLNPTQELFYADEISIRGNNLILGATKSPTDPDPAIRVPLATISGIMDLAGSYVEGTTVEAYNQLRYLIQPENFNNMAPIIHRQIDQHLGIYIELSMATTDDTEWGEMCYITVLRNSDVHIPHDGYGMAWRKQPEFLLRLDKGAGYYTDEDVKTFKEHYDGIDPVAAGLVGNLHLNANRAFWKYNVYLVDNDVLQEEVWIGHDQFFDQTSGKNQFLAADKAWIEPNITYSIVLKIYETLGFEGWIYNTSYTDTWKAPTLAGTEEANRILYRGSTYPTFVPVSGDKVARSNGVEVIDSALNHFGISVAQTRNCEWTVGDLVIRSFIETFPMHLFKFKIDLSDWEVTDDFTVTYYGVGYDSYLFSEEESGHSSVQCVIYNTTTEEWETVGTHTATIDDGVTNIESLKITDTLSPLSDYLDEDLYIQIAASATNSGPDFPDDTSHSLRTYYVKIDNTEPAGIHRGNTVDVYVHDPENLKVATTVLTVANGKVNTNTTAFRGYIVDIVEVREYLSKVPFDRSSYTLVNNNKGDSYSSSANYDIIFDSDDIDGALVEVEYRYWSQGDLVNTLLTDSDYRYPAADLAVKAMPVHIVNIEKLEYSGGLRVDQMRAKIIEYFNELDERTFDKSDIVNILYTNGATYVDLDIVIRIRNYNTVFTYSSEVMDGQTYVIPYNTVGGFFTNEDELIGVEQV